MNMIQIILIYLLGYCIAALILLMIEGIKGNKIGTKEIIYPILGYSMFSYITIFLSIVVLFITLITYRSKI